MSFKAYKGVITKLVGKIDARIAVGVSGLPDEAEKSLHSNALADRKAHLAELGSLKTVLQEYQENELEAIKLKLIEGKKALEAKKAESRILNYGELTPEQWIAKIEEVKVLLEGAVVQLNSTKDNLKEKQAELGIAKSTRDYDDAVKTYHQWKYLSKDYYKTVSYWKILDELSRPDLSEADREEKQTVLNEIIRDIPHVIDGDKERNFEEFDRNEANREVQRHYFENEFAKVKAVEDRVKAAEDEVTEADITVYGLKVEKEGIQKKIET